MNDLEQLERRYRRLLACYPRHFRREHEEEMLQSVSVPSHCSPRCWRSSPTRTATTRSRLVTGP
jgi:hypothetical protein